MESRGSWLKHITWMMELVDLEEGKVCWVVQCWMMIQVLGSLVSYYEARTLQPRCRIHVQHMSDTDTPRTRHDTCPIRHMVCPIF